MPNDNPYAALPSISALIIRVRAEGIVLSDSVANTLFNEVIGQARSDISRGSRPTRDYVVACALSAANELFHTRLAPIINATGVLLHTNLGRAPVSTDAAEAMRRAAADYVSVEIDPESGQRGGRMDELSRLMRLLTGAEATLVVNNNAAAVLLTLSALASGQSVIVSRGEAVEIGGGFRIPDVLRQSGAHLVEVGTTNRTYARDYETAIDDSTALVLKVHPSNFSISGFTSSASISELASIAGARKIPVVEDLGSGALLDTRQFGIPAEPTIRGSLAAGASVITASGDKLLGGPQAGIISGKKILVDQIARHPLARAVRADKTCLAGLAATLRHYVRGDALVTIPIWRMMSATKSSLQERGQEIVSALCSGGLTVRLLPSTAVIGGGSLPGQTIESWGVVLDAQSGNIDELARRLRLGDPGVFARIVDDQLVLDLRTVLPEHDLALTVAIARAVSQSS